LIVGDGRDLCSVYLKEVACLAGHDVMQLEEGELGETWALDLEVNNGTSGGIEVRGRRLNLSSVDAAFVRLSPDPGLPTQLCGLDDRAQEFLVLERRTGLQWFLDTAPFVVMNRPSAGRCNGSKPLHMRNLQALGLQVPDWIVTNDAAEAVEFARASADGAIYKACSGLRCQVRRVDHELFTRLRAGTTPVLLQRFVPGYDVRVHTVGSRSFAARIDSEDIDYRFGTPVSYARVDLPPEIAGKCEKAVGALGLVIGGIDFRVGADGGWWCLEVNPVPTFLPYEIGAGLPIAQAIVEHAEALAR